MERNFSFDDAVFTPGIRALLARVTPGAGERVLDVACGAGIPARLLGGTAGVLTSLDIGPNILKKARALYDGAAPAHWVRGDMLALPFADGAFDLVLCHQGVQFCADPAAAVREMARVTADDGRMGIMAWATIARSPCYAALAAALADELGAAAADFVRRPFSLPTAAELHALLDRTGVATDVVRIDVPVAIDSVAAFAAGFLRYLPPHLAAGGDPHARLDGIVARMVRSLDGEGPLALSMTAHIGTAGRR